MNVIHKAAPWAAAAPRPQPDCASLFALAPEVQLKRGSAVFSAGDHGTCVYFVTAGTIKTAARHNGKEILLDYYGAGELINCGLALAAQQQGVYAEAMTKRAAFRRLPVELFQQALSASEVLRAEVLGQTCAALGRAQERLRWMSLPNTQQRLASFLLSYARCAGRRVGLEYVIQPIMTQQEIGSLTGTGRQTTTAALNAWRKRGLIHFNRRYLIIRELDALREIASAAAAAKA